MNPTVQVSGEIQVELSRFYNVDLFHRGFYHVKVSLETQNRDRRIQVSLEKSEKEYLSEQQSEAKSTRARRVQCPILPACISSDGLTATSKTFLILYKQDCITLNDTFKFRLDVLQPVDALEENFVKSELALKVELWYADEDEPSDEDSLRGTMRSVAQRTLRVHADLRNGSHSYMPCTFDYYHLSTVCITVHTTLLNICLPTFRFVPAESQHSGAGSRSRAADSGKSNSSNTQVLVPIDEATRSDTLGNLLFHVPGGGTNAGELRERHARASERYGEMCTLLLGAQESIRRQLFELKCLVPHALDVQTSSAGLAARLDAMCETVKVAGNESEVAEIVMADLAQLVAEIDLLWTHYLSIVTLNPLVTQFYAVRYQQQRVRRMAEGFFAIEYRKPLLLDAQERTLVPHEELAAMVRSSDYFQALQPLAIECVVTDGTAETLPIVFEEAFVDDSDVQTVNGDSMVEPALRVPGAPPGRIATQHSPVSVSISPDPDTAHTEQRARSATDVGHDSVSLSGSTVTNSTSSDSPSLRSVRAASKVSSASAGSVQTQSHAEALLSAKERQRADLRRIAHASNSRGKHKHYSVNSSGQHSSNSKTSVGTDSTDGRSRVALVGFRKLNTTLHAPSAIGSLDSGVATTGPSQLRQPHPHANGDASSLVTELDADTHDELDKAHMVDALSLANAVVLDQQAAVSALRRAIADELVVSRPRLFEVKQARSRSRLDLRHSASPTHSELGRPAALAAGRSIWQLAQPSVTVNSWLSLPDLAVAANTFDQPLAVRVGPLDQSATPSDADGDKSARVATPPSSPAKSADKPKGTRASDDVLGILEMLGEPPRDKAAAAPASVAKRNVTAAEILASRSKDRQRVDYLLEFEQRGSLGNGAQPPTAMQSDSVSNVMQTQRSIVPAVPDCLIRFIRLKEEFKRRMARSYAGHLCSDQAFLASTCPFFWAPPSSSKLLAPQPASDPGLHLVVFVHGMDGYAHDLRSARIALEHALPATRFDFLMSKKNERATSPEMDVLGERLVSEILQHIDSRGTMPGRISFVGFSLGNIIIRTALASPGLQHLLPKLHTLLSLAGPHLGVLYQTSALVGFGTWLMRKWRKSDSLVQLCLKDHADLRQTFIYRLSRSPSFALFRHVLLVSSPQDHYVPRHSARVELANSIVRDSNELGRVYVEMLANLLSPVATSSHTQLVRFDAVFALPNDTNAFIGRAAHCAVMENELFLEKFFTVAAAKYFR